mmetsp:Transcript_77149/g.154673  ORF Transcript_77149/g.154673 Transcript_77149/m.154673 type:complete len:282 (+) Transcript_77149:133-978(+)
MAHMERRTDPAREFLLGIVGGAIYGGSHTLSGHPLDNLKTRLQLDKNYRGLSTFEASHKLWAETGVRGFLQGFWPPFLGSCFYRMAMLSSYEASYTFFSALPEGDPWKMEIGGGYFPRPMVFASALCSSLCRSAVESPFEYAKVMRQTDGMWKVADCYRGVTAQTVRTTSMLMCIFGPYDVVRTKKPEWMSTLLRQWLTTTLVCGGSYAIIWPLETLKNQAQAGVPHPGASVAQRVEYLGGFKGLYRGAAPGIVAGGIRNGAAMFAMANWQRFATSMGLRD